MPDLLAATPWLAVAARWSAPEASQVFKEAACTS